MTAGIAENPGHKISELTTYELRGYRRELEEATAFYDEQDDRARIARA
jgi:hypothetical protein